jgi:hypothetical protein
VTYHEQLTEIYNKIKQMKLKNCITLDKQSGITETAKIIKKSITKRTYDSNEIYLKMDDFCNWSIHEHNINDLIITDDSIQLFDNDSFNVTFTK